MFVIKYQKFFIALSALFVIFSIGAVSVLGLPLGIDFKGGSALEYSYVDERPLSQMLEAELGEAGFDDATVQPIGERAVLIKTRTLSDEERTQVLQVLSADGEREGVQQSFTAIGPSVGAELRNKAIVSIVLVLIAIICFVAYAFRKVSKPVSSWKYGLAVIIALVHDVIIPTGFFAIFAHYTGAEVDTLFVVALLTTLALSVSDTIVVFDRVREHLQTDTGKQKSFAKVVGESLSETFVRSLNTSLLVLAMVVTLALVGPESTQLFALILSIGLFFGIYSSIFLASPLLVLMERVQKKKS